MEKQPPMPTDNVIKDESTDFVSLAQGLEGKTEQGENYINIKNEQEQIIYKKRYGEKQTKDGTTQEWAWERKFEYNDQGRIIKETIQDLKPDYKLVEIGYGEFDEQGRAGSEHGKHIEGANTGHEYQKQIEYQTYDSLTQAKIIHGEVIAQGASDEEPEAGHKWIYVEETKPDSDIIIKGKYFLTPHHPGYEFPKGPGDWNKTEFAQKNNLFNPEEKPEEEKSEKEKLAIIEAALGRTIEEHFATFYIENALRSDLERPFQNIYDREKNNHGPIKIFSKDFRQGSAQKKEIRFWLTSYLYQKEEGEKIFDASSEERSKFHDSKKELLNDLEELAFRKLEHYIAEHQLEIIECIIKNMDRAKEVRDETALIAKKKEKLTSLKAGSGEYKSLQAEIDDYTKELDLDKKWQQKYSEFLPRMKKTVEALR